MIGDLDHFYCVHTVINSELIEEGKKIHRRYGGKEAEFWKYEYNYRSSIAKAIHERLRAKLKLNIPGVHKEWDKRKSTKLQKLIRNAEFRYPNACMESIEYHPDRKLDKGQMLEFSTCRYISDDHHIILKGASGNGKTYIACALGIAACRNFIKVRYVRLPDLLNELAVAHGDGTLKKVIKAYQKIDLLILDEFLLSPVSTEQTRELLEIIEARSVKGSVIFKNKRVGLRFAWNIKFQFHVLAPPEDDFYLYKLY